jgi:hypothetical protein
MLGSESIYKDEQEFISGGQFRVDSAGFENLRGDPKWEPVGGHLKATTYKVWSVHLTQTGVF